MTAKTEFKQKININRKTGFTLIEILISLAMIAILTGATLQIVRFSDTQKSLIIESDKFRSAVREAQNYSLSVPNNDSEHICGFGIKVASGGSSYELFYTRATDWTNPKNACEGCYKFDNISSSCMEGIIGAKTNLADGITFSSDKDEDIFFKVPYGDVYQKGAVVSGTDATFEISYKGRKQTIKINKFGKVE